MVGGSAGIFFFLDDHFFVGLHQPELFPGLPLHRLGVFLERLDVFLELGLLRLKVPDLLEQRLVVSPGL